MHDEKHMPGHPGGMGGHPGGHPGTAGAHPGGHPGGAPGHKMVRTLEDGTPACKLIAWEVTRSCNLACKHCRAEAHPEPYPGELSTEEAKALIDTFPSVGNPIIIFTGGDPMIRPDVYELIAYAGSKGLRCVMSPNGTLITPENARKIKEAGVQRCSISIDGYNAEKHDAFRCVPGAFDATMRGIVKTVLNNAKEKVEIYGFKSFVKPGYEKINPQCRYQKVPAYTTPKPDSNEFVLVSGKNATSCSGAAMFAATTRFLGDRTLWMNPRDARRLGIANKDFVMVEGVDRAYQARVQVTVTKKVIAGSVFAFGFSGGVRTKTLINDPRFAFVKEGINSHWYATGYAEPLSGALANNACVRVIPIKG